MINALFSSTEFQLSLLILSIVPTFVLFINYFFDIPGVIRFKIDVFSPQFILAGCLLIGTTIRTFYLLYDPNGYQNMVTLVAYSLPEDILLSGLLAINLFTILWLIGYSFVSNKTAKRQQSVHIFDEARYWKIQGMLIVVGVAVMFLYLLQINFFSQIGSYGVSGKRMFQVGSEYGNVTTYGYLKVAGEILAACTIAQAVFYYGHRRTRMQAVILFALFCLAIVIPFVASARGDILYLLLAIIVIRHYLIKRVSLNFMLVLTVLFFFVLGIMGILRQQAYRGVDNVETSVSESTINTLVYNAHFVGVGKTSVILDEMPYRENFLFGQTYAMTLIAPIPRIFWQDKPVVRAGRFVGTRLYRKPSFSGVPPGFLGESYMNFGWFGILVLVPLLGYGCKRIYLHLVVLRDRADLLRVGLYGIAVILLLDIYMTDFTGTVMRALKLLIPFMIIMKFSLISQRAYRVQRSRVRRSSLPRIHSRGRST